MVGIACLQLAENSALVDVALELERVTARICEYHLASLLSSAGMLHCRLVHERHLRRPQSLLELKKLRPSHDRAKVIAIAPELSRWAD